MTSIFKTVQHAVRAVPVMAAAMTIVGAGVAAADEVHVINWNGWGTDQPFAVEHFKEATGTDVVHDYHSSFEEMFTKMRTNPGAYDVGIINEVYVRNAAEEGLIQPIDESKLDNFGDLFAAMRDSPEFTIDGKLYAVAWIWGATSISYNTDVFDTPPTSVNVLWDPAHEGRVCWRDDAVDSVQFAALALGQDPDNPSDMDAIRQKLRDLKPQIRSMWSSEDQWLKSIGGNECDVSIMWTDSTEKAKENFDQPVAFIVAEEGALAWRDAVVIPADAPNPDAAYAFLNYLTGTDFYADWAEAGGAPVTANALAIDALSEASMTRQVLADPANVDRLHFGVPIPDATREQYLELWEETKAYYGE